MSLVIAILLGIILILYCINDKAKITEKGVQYEKNHPPCKYQEEYLLACKYYHQYLFGGESAENAFNLALRSAREDIYRRGYLPSNLIMAGMNAYKSSVSYQQKTLIGTDTWFEPHDPPRIGSAREIHVVINDPGYSGGLLDWRFFDEKDILNSLKKSLSKTPHAWNDYCAEIDDQFDSLVLSSLISWGLIDGTKHQGKWINSMKLSTVPFEVRKSIELNDLTYEAISENHQEQLPSLLEDERQKQKMMDDRNIAYQQALNERPYARGRAYNKSRYE